ncbi:MAG: cyclic nucleotide-binding domain-containing protein [Spirochaetes bacterium]|nr:cyclic nucleotide-binding domain-containing protein [Spirochaetota bacterium]
MPQAIKYKAKSIIYFEGDVSDKVFILQSGKVSLISTDIDTGMQNRELVKTGEFFGVKSSLGKFPREETADVLVDSVVLVFGVLEFEKLIYANPRITLQMLKVFSNQLRRIHRQVENLLATEEQVNPEKGLFGIGEYYFKAQKFKPALYALRRYLTYYPAGVHQARATEYLVSIEKCPPGKTPAVSPAHFAKGFEGGSSASADAAAYFNGVTLFSAEKYEEAISSFKQYVSANPEAEYAVKALSEIGKAFYSLKKYDECIKHFSTMIQKYSKHAEVGEFLLYLGMSCNAKGDKAKAEGFFNKVIQIAEEGSETKRKAKKELKELGGR